MNRIASLDGLRGVAILLVLAGHALAHIPGLSTVQRDWLLAFFNAGFGVRLFFVLSGYLITELLLREHRRDGQIAIGAFYRRRARRILPAFYCYLAAVAGWLIWRGTPLPLSSWLGAATFVQNYAVLWTAPDSGSVYWNIGHIWTLCVESQFYLIWPPVFVLLRPQRAKWVALAVVLLSPLVRVGTYFLFPDLRGYLGVMLHTDSDGLALGCATALFLNDPRVHAFLGRWRRKGLLLSLSWITLIAPWGRHEIPGFNIAIGFTGDALAAAWIIAVLHRFDCGWLERVTGQGFLPALGLISYSLYLWQQPFLGPEGWITQDRPLLAFILPIILAVISFLCIESRFAPRKALESLRRALHLEPSHAA